MGNPLYIRRSERLGYVQDPFTTPGWIRLLLRESDLPIRRTGMVESRMDCGLTLRCRLSNKALHSDAVNRAREHNVGLKMRECSCRGGNPVCARCGGSGVLPGDPVRREESGIDETWRKTSRGRSSKRRRCPHCGEMVKRKHVARCPWNKSNKPGGR